MKTLLTIVLFWAAATNARASEPEFTGQWIGSGTLLSAELTVPTPIVMAISLELNETQLLIKDCWKSADLQLDRCYTSHYDVAENGKIFKQGKRIGDIFPDEIVIFDGNSQVSEQMVFELNWARTLRYRYVFSTLDGGSQVRSGALQVQAVSRAAG